MTDRIYLYDSTLRDGAQTSGVDFTAADKITIAQKLDEIGIDYIEGGWPGANPTDDEFFNNLPKLTNSRISAFGMTKKHGNSAQNDPFLSAVVNTGVGTVCLFGKTWDFHVIKALGIELKDNIKMIEESISHLRTKNCEAIFDAEHFFDGYKANKQYAIDAIKAAYQSGARWVVLCDTNGGTLPHEIGEIVSYVSQIIPGTNLGIHCHNDTENAVANSITAVLAGARQVQGTLNGVGERCGNANLVSIIPNLMLKLGYKTGVKTENLKYLTKISRFLDERLNRQPNIFAPYVGASAFAHKGGMHVSAVAKNPNSYEHIEPHLVGNKRNILISDQAGKANIIERLKEIGLDVSGFDKSLVDALVRDVKQRESKGYAYDNADASFEILARKMLGQVPDFFDLRSFRVIDERRWDANGKLVTLSEATVKLIIDDKKILTVAEGNGPVNALDNALKDALLPKYPSLQNVVLTDYKVRIVNSGDGTKAITRVMIESQDDKNHKWTTIGVSANIIDASYNALRDSIDYKLLHEKLKTWQTTQQ